MKRTSIFLSRLATIFFLSSTLIADGATPTEVAPPSPIIVEPPSSVVDEVPVTVTQPSLPPRDSVVPALFNVGILVSDVPNEPHNERRLGPWSLEVHAIDEFGQTAGAIYYGHTDANGAATLELPGTLHEKPMVVTARNKLFPPRGEDEFTKAHQYEIFIPPHCAQNAVYMAGPFEDALWSYYKNAASKGSESWNPSQVDCGTWLVNLQLLLFTDDINDGFSDDPEIPFKKTALTKAFQENPHLLTPTRPPICMAERRHSSGHLELGKEIARTMSDASIILDEPTKKNDFDALLVDNDPVAISAKRGLPESVCGIKLANDSALNVNGALFSPTKNYWLDDDGFPGTVHQQQSRLLDVTTYNVRLGNGRERDSETYDDACAVTGLIKFTNRDDVEVDIEEGTGITLTNLFDSNEANTAVHLTSDGDNVVDSHDTWAIFKRTTDIKGHELVFAVELLGHRQGDYRDTLVMSYDSDTESLFLGLRADYQLNEEDVDGEHGYLKYTVHVWDGTTRNGRWAVHKDLANCYEASDVWARQFYDVRANTGSALDAAEFAVRSQCFSNSRSNQYWASQDAGFWSIGTDHGVSGNVVFNAGWLAPDEHYELFIQKFDEAVFKGPRVVEKTDAAGQLMVAVPTLIEGDRILLKAKNEERSDYDVVIHCDPEFTGFAGTPGIPYLPVLLSPPVVLPPIPWPAHPPTAPTAPMPFPVPGEDDIDERI